MSLSKTWAPFPRPANSGPMLLILRPFKVHTRPDVPSARGPSNKSAGAHWNPAVDFVYVKTHGYEPLNYVRHDAFAAFLAD
jgi:hypothetical protein